MRTLLTELRIQSDNFSRPIKHIWYPIQEVARFTNSPHEEVKNSLRLLIDKGYLNQKSSEPLIFELTEKGKQVKTDKEIEEIIKEVI